MPKRAVRPRAFTIRNAVRADARSIAAIYNDAVATTTATFDTHPRSLPAQRRWLREHRPPFVARVAETAEGLVGWSSLSPWSDRPGYARTAEVSIYVHAAWRGRGIGRRLLRDLRDRAEGRRFHTLLAVVVGENATSLHLHADAGFQEVGVLREVGQKFGRRIDVHLLQLMLPEPGGAPAGRARRHRSVRRRPRAQS
ncbi:MAG: GNAT family N-acetyltransferase [Thermoplasmata archaeon]